jgi:penicillin-binding protein 1A
MMAETIRSGTATKAAFGWPAAGKTGTSQNSRDAWFIGYTANLVTGIWFGNDDGKPTKNVTGGSLPALAWKAFMTAALDGEPVAELPGRRTSGGGDGFPARPETPIPAAKPSAAVAAAKPAAPRAAPELESTSSVPRPKADVGGRKVREKSLVDIILGK